MDTSILISELSVLSISITSGKPPIPNSPPPHFSISGFYPANGLEAPNLTIWNRIAGNIGCTNYAIAQIEELESPAYAGQIAATQSFYDSLAPTVFWDYDASLIHYGNAWVLYEYALYQYNHNRSNPISSEALSQLYSLASQQQFELNSPNTFGTIPSIAGQTFASVVLQQFSHAIASSGVADKLTLMFGSFEPMLSFFALSNLSTGPSAQRFNMLPMHGSSMSFELFSNTGSDSSNQNLSTPFPSTEELFVRFLFRNGTSDTDPIIEYPLFGRGNSEDDMSWVDFVQGMGDFSLDDVVEWCAQCDSINLFCQAIESDITNTTVPVSSSSKKSLSPAIGGVIGATVTLAVAIIAVVILGLCGFRLDYHEKRAKGVAVPEVGGIGVLKRSGSGKVGGFKGAEKLASDTDLRLKGGAGATVIRHERVGSWELNESPSSPRGQSSLDKDVESGRMERVVTGADYSRRSEDDGVNPFGDPVKPVDQV
jgi:hypothetical protein